MDCPSSKKKKRQQNPKKISYFQISSKSGPSKETTLQNQIFCCFVCIHKGVIGKRSFHKSTSVEEEVGLLPAW